MIKHVVTMGLGFSDGVYQIPPLGLLLQTDPLTPLTMPAWPAALPDPELPSYREQEAVGAVRSSIDASVPIMRRRTASGPQLFDCAWALTRAQVAILDAFYTIELADGSATFIWEHPRSKELARLRFVSGPQYEPHGYNAWRVTCQMEVLS